MSVVYKGDQRRGRRWKDLFAELDPDVQFHLWPEVGNPEEVKYLVAWEASNDFLKTFPNLQVLFSVGAGTDQFDLAQIPDSVLLVRMLDPGIAQGMVEYVTCATLNLHRHMLDYVAFQREAHWQPIQLQPASDRRVGIMGLGNLGQAVIKQLKTLGFPLYGWSRSPHSIDEVTCFAGWDQLQDFLHHCDILICLLPLTDETRGILDQNVFDAMPPGAGLINVGRGGHLCEQDLLSSLNSGHLTGAVLDVMNEEPPRKDHPFWSHSRILLTPHVAAMTQPETAGRVLLENIQRHQRGETMSGVVERDRGY